MARSGSVSPISIPPFVGATRNLLLWNMLSYLVLAVLGFALPALAARLFLLFALRPEAVVHGMVWQLVTYSFLGGGFINIIFAMMSLWYAGNFLEGTFGSRWIYQLYFSSVAGGAVLIVPLAYLHPFGMSEMSFGTQQWGGIFGLLVAVGYFYAETEFNVMFVLRMKAKVMVTLYIVLFTLEMMTQHDPFGAALQLAGGLAGYTYCRLAPRRGYAVGTSVSERFFALRNAFYRNRRRQAAKKFEVYMGKQGRQVHFDKDGRYVEQDEPKDNRWMN